MKNIIRIGALLGILLTMLVPISAQADTWEFKFPIIITDTSNVTRSYYPVVLPNGQSSFSSYTSNGMDTNMQEGATDRKYMMSTTNITTIVPNLSAGGRVTHDLYTGYDPVQTSFPIITGEDGYTTTSDSVNLEPSANASIIFTDTYTTTSDNEEDEIYVLKPQAFKMYGNSGNLTAVSGNHTSLLDFEATNSDNVSIPDSTAFTFNTSGQDTAFSFSGWYKPEANAGVLTIIAKQDTATTCEWVLYVDATNKVNISLRDSTATTSLLKITTNAITDAVWNHISVTYSGSETIDGIKIYLDSVYQTSTTNTTTGAYAGMSNTVSKVVIGSIAGSNFLDGSLSNWKIYSSELSSTQVLDDYYGINRRANLIAWYKFIDGAGNPVDSSGNGHNATTNLADWLLTGGAYLGAIEANMTLSDGESDFRYVSDSVNMWVTNDASSSANVSVSSIANSTFSWIWVRDVSYSGSINLLVGGSQQLLYLPNAMIQGTALPDRGSDATNNEGVITYGTNQDITITYGGVESSGSTSVSEVVVDTGENAQDMPMPNRWFGAYQLTANQADASFVGVLFYETIHQQYIDGGYPTLTVYATIFIGAALIIFLLLAVKTHSIFAALAGAVLILFAGSQTGTAGAIPLWLPTIGLIMELALIFTYRQVV